MKKNNYLFFMIPLFISQHALGSQLHNDKISNWNMYALFGSSTTISTSKQVQLNQAQNLIYKKNLIAARQRSLSDQQLSAAAPISIPRNTQYSQQNHTKISRTGRLSLQEEAPSPLQKRLSLERYNFFKLNETLDEFDEDDRLKNSSHGQEISPETNSPDDMNDEMMFAFDHEN